MELQTRDFGRLSYEEKDVITFPFGLVAFGHLHRYILLEPEENSPWRTLQSVEDSRVAFTVVDPWAIVPGYDPKVSPEDLEFMGLASEEQGAFLAIAVVPEDIRETTVNLRAPIVINPKTRLAWQVILLGESYPLRHYVFGNARSEGLQVAETMVVVERRGLHVDAILAP